MLRRSSLLALLLLWGWSATSVYGQFYRSPLVSQDEARRHGLVRAWATQVQMDRTRDRIQNIVLYQKHLPVGPAAPSTGKPLRIGADPAAGGNAPAQQDPPAAADENNPFGDGGANPFGAANDGNANPFGNNDPAAGNNPFGNAPPAGNNPFGNAPADGKEPPPAAGPQPNQPANASGQAGAGSIPQPGTMIVQTERGLLQALDAETGRTLWVVQAGHRERPTESPAVSAKHVALINGMSLILLNAENGQILWERTMPTPSICGPTLTDEFAYTLSADGKLTAYDLKDPSKNWAYTSFGRVDAPVTRGRKSVAWATNKGYVYISRLNQLNVIGRFETGKSITAPITYWPPLFYVASQDGYVYALDEVKGTAMWKFSLGEVIREQAIAAGDSVYAIPETGGLLALTANTGLEKWFVPLIEKLLAVSPRRLYAVDAQQRLAVLDKASGAPVTTMRLDGLNFFFSNLENDRIYLGTDTGLIQCLHEMDLKHPAVHSWPMEATQATQIGDAAQPQE